MPLASSYTTTAGLYLYVIKQLVTTLRMLYYIKEINEKKRFLVLNKVAQRILHVEKL